jgi:CRP-like cAMP-binding protein
MNELDEKLKLQTYIKYYQLESVFPESSLEILKLCFFEVDQLIVEESAPVKYLHLLLKGKARVSPTSEEGKTALLYFVIPKDVIGDLEYFAKDEYYYNVTALLPCTTLAIPVVFIKKYFGENVNFYKFICENMANKMKRTSLKYSNTLLYSIKHQIATYFYELYTENKQTLFPILFKETSEFFGITPRYLRSILGELEDEEILIREVNGVQLLDLEKLRHYTTYK